MDIATARTLDEHQIQNLAVSHASLEQELSAHKGKIAVHATKAAELAAEMQSVKHQHEAEIKAHEETRAEASKAISALAQKLEVLEAENAKLKAVMTHPDAKKAIILNEIEALKARQKQLQDQLFPAPPPPPIPAKPN
jgi:chromosome segregation ATPase